jgi:TPR repeat protein
MAISKKISWIEGERLLRSAGKRSEAIALLRQEISKNNRLAAKIVLATMYGADAGLSDTEIDRIIDDAEREVKDSDVDAHRELYRAYEMYIGGCSPELKPHLAFKHLLVVAKNGNNALDAFAVANHFQYGNQVTPPNLFEAKRWYEIAHLRGHPEALRKIKSLTRKLNSTQKNSAEN